MLWVAASRSTTGPVIRKIAREAASDDYRWSSIILGIVKSTPFQMIKREEHSRWLSPVNPFDRRTFLRGTGAALALPLLDAMTPAFAVGAARPIRLAFFEVPNGIMNLQNKFSPKSEARRLRPDADSPAARAISATAC